MSIQARIMLTDAVVPCGSPVNGTVSWSGNDKGQEVGAVLCYRTEGRGDEDSRVAGEYRLGNAQRGEVSFGIVVPIEGPVSYSGSLLRVLWHVVVVVPPKGRVPRLERTPAGMPLSVVPWGWPS